MPRASFTKVRSLAGLATSFVIFGLYFKALGLVLNEFGVSLKAYLAGTRHRTGDELKAGDCAIAEATRSQL